MKRNEKLKWGALLFAGLFACMLFITACGSESKIDTATAAAGGVNGAEYGENDVMEQLNPEAKATGEAVAEDAGGKSEEGDPQIQSGRKLIRNFELSLETRQFDALYQDIQRDVTANGGYFENASLRSNGLYGDGTRTVYLVVRMPADQADAFLQNITKALGEDGSILYQNEAVEDVTLRYTDVESHKKALETEQVRLLELLKKAESVEDIISIENRLSEVRYELESYASQLRQFDNQIDYSTFTIDVNEVQRLEAVEQDNLWVRMGKGLSRTFGNIADGAQDCFVFVVVNSPYLIAFAVLVVFAVFLIRRKRRKYQRNIVPAPVPSTPDNTDTPPVAPDEDPPAPKE